MGQLAIQPVGSTKLNEVPELGVTPADATLFLAPPTATITSLFFAVLQPACRALSFLSTRHGNQPLLAANPLAIPRHKKCRLEARQISRGKIPSRDAHKPMLPL